MTHYKTDPPEREPEYHLVLFLIIITNIFGANIVLAQERIASIKLGTNPIKNIQAFAAGDTIFLSYQRCWI